MNSPAAVPEMLSCQGNDGEGHAHLNLPGERLLRDPKVASKPRRDVGHYAEHDDTSGYRRTNMTELTLEPGVLRVAPAFPDPPFEVTIDGKDTGFDVDKGAIGISNIILTTRFSPHWTTCPPGI